MKLLKAIPFTIALLSACSRQDTSTNPPASEPKLAQGASEDQGYRAESNPPAQSALGRIDQINAEVSAWRSAPDLDQAKRHAEAARNLIVGPTGPGYGDVDEDGRVSGGNQIGLLPGLKGGAALAVPAANTCVTRDLLGGSWENPIRRWEILDAKVAAWRPGINTFPTLPSHAQRIVGWASLALGSSKLGTATEYAAHAKLHVDVSRTALTRC